MKRLTSNAPLTEAEAMNLSVTNLYARLKEYEDTGLEPEDILTGLEMAYLFAELRKLDEVKKAEAEGRLSVLPRATDITIERDGLLYKGDHWSPPILTAFADDLTTRTGKRVCLFYPEEVKCAEAALRGGADG